MFGLRAVDLMVAISMIVWVVFHRWRSRWGAEEEQREDRTSNEI
jgi:hypothetical protein